MTAILTVTVNPCLDVVKEIDEEELVTGTYRPIKSSESPGGKGIDVSRAIKAVRSVARKPIESTAIGFVGGYTGGVIQGLLQIEDIQTDFVEISNESGTNVIVHLKNRREIRINSEGPQISGPDYDRLLKKIDSYSNRDLGAAAICGSVCRGMMFAGSYNQIIRRFKELIPRCITYLDTGELQTNYALQSNNPPDFVKPNIDEFFKLLKHSGTMPNGNFAASEEELQSRYCNPLAPDIEKYWNFMLDCYRKISTKYPHTKILLSLSGLGALCFDNNLEKFIHVYYHGSVQIETFVGAGDSFLGGFMVAYSDSNDLGAALKAGISASVSRLAGEHEFHGYIDTDLLQEISSSECLSLREFDASEVGPHLAAVAADYSRDTTASGTTKTQSTEVKKTKNSNGKNEINRSGKSSKRKPRSDGNKKNPK